MLPAFRSVTFLCLLPAYKISSVRDCLFIVYIYFCSKYKTKIAKSGIVHIQTNDISNDSMNSSGKQERTEEEHFRHRREFRDFLHTIGKQAARKGLLLHFILQCLPASYIRFPICMDIEWVTTHDILHNNVLLKGKWITLWEQYQQQQQPILLKYTKPSI